jgi:hypothetical protein
MQVQVEAAAEALKVAYSRVLVARDLGRALVLDGDGLDEDAAEGAGDVRAERRQSSKLEGEREHPLAHGNRGQDAVDEVRGGVGHPAPGAARAQSSALACQRDEQVPPVVVAMGSQQATAKTPQAT